MIEMELNKENNKYYISGGKTLFDMFSMINPNCYQTLIMKSIVDGDKNGVLFYCDKLAETVKYYKWDIAYKKNDYIDSLICMSELELWQKRALLYIISNDTDNCKREIELSLFAKSKASYAYKNKHDYECADDCIYSLNDVFNINNFGV